MCGITGFVSREAGGVATLTGALKHLEYRGYDSCGVAAMRRDGKLGVHKSVQSVSRLASEMAQHDGFDWATATIGIAHTRWATHGGATLANAHPHTANQRLFAVHNGIIDNESELKSKLSEPLRGSIVSETDTEVVVMHCAMLLEQGLTMQQALEQTRTSLQGNYAFVFVDTQTPETLWFFCHQSPLMLGKTDSGFMLASDPVALAPYCESYAIIDRPGVFSLQAHESETKRFDWCTWRSTQLILQGMTRSDTMAGHQTYAEIQQQPAILKRIMDMAIRDERLHYQNGSALFARCKQVLLLGCGSSYYAADVVGAWIEKQLRIPARSVLASAYRTRATVLAAHTLVITFSQSGETMDTLLALRYIKAQQVEGVTTLCVCNRMHSSLARESDAVLDCMAGAEIGVATTKAFTAQLYVCWSLLVYAKHAQREACTQMIPTFSPMLVGAVEQALALDAEVQIWAKRVQDTRSMYFLARGEAVAIAFEAALKMKELTYIHAEGYHSAELKHGPLALIEDDFWSVLLVHDEQTMVKMQVTAKEISARGGGILLVGPACYVQTIKRSFAEKRQSNILVLSSMDAFDEEAILVFLAVTMQLFAYHTANIRGCQVDKPRNLAKCVTVE